MSGDFQDEIGCLGIEASPSFVREPEGNGVAERFIRTLKENLLWVRTFDTIEDLRAALVEFATRYNENWLVVWYGYRTQAQPGWPGLRAAAGQRPFDTPQSVALRHGGAAIQMHGKLV
jgi:transposase InsO family protein